MLKKDRYITGVIIGILVPAVLYSVFHISMELWRPGIMNSRIIEKSILFFIALNALLMRHFMVKREQDRIGRSILIVTFLGALAYMMYYYT